MFQQSKCEKLYNSKQTSTTSVFSYVSLVDPFSIFNRPLFNVATIATITTSTWQPQRQKDKES